MQIAASVIPLFDVFLIDELSCGTILMIEGHPQCQNIYVRSNKRKYDF